MERLTKRLEDGQAVMDCAACGVSWHKKRKKDIPYCTALFCRNRLKERLAAYEDTGMEPEEIKDNMEMFRAYRHICAGHEPEHIRDLIQSEQDGRLVVLPCKVVCGTTIWWADSSIHADPIKCEVSSFGIYTGSDGGLQLWMNCYVYGSTPTSRSFRMSSIGKTAFLTREEAEAALAGKGDANEADSV